MTFPKGRQTIKIIDATMWASSFTWLWQRTGNHYFLLVHGIGKAELHRRRSVEPLIASWHCFDASTWVFRCPVYPEKTHHQILLN